MSLSITGDDRVFTGVPFHSESISRQRSVLPTLHALGLSCRRGGCVLFERIDFEVAISPRCCAEDVEHDACRDAADDAFVLAYAFAVASSRMRAEVVECEADRDWLRSATEGSAQ